MPDGNRGTIPIHLFSVTRIALCRISLTSAGIAPAQGRQIPGSVDECGNEDDLVGDAIEEAIARDEELAPVGIVEFRDDATALGQGGEGGCGAMSSSHERGGVDR